MYCQGGIIDSHSKKCRLYASLSLYVDCFSFSFRGKLSVFTFGVHQKNIKTQALIHFTVFLILVFTVALQLVILASSM